jgi:hypothetical protein
MNNQRAGHLYYKTRLSERHAFGMLQLLVPLHTDNRLRKGNKSLLMIKLRSYFQIRTRCFWCRVVTFEEKENEYRGKKGSALTNEIISKGC